MDMKWPRDVTVLCGGVGAAKFITGLARIFPPERITAIVNTGDDIMLHGLYISPDVDIITYSLAGVIDEEKGWGICDDTFHCLNMLGKLGQETWFKLGDQDIAIHILRSHLLRKGVPLSEITDLIRKALGVKSKILPMSNDKVETRIIVEAGNLHFQEYLVKRRMKDKIISIRFRGIGKARPAPGVMQSINQSDLLIIAPSNPLVSIGPIISIKGVRQALRQRNKPTVAISPIIGGKAIKGPLELMFRSFGFEPSAYEVVKMYRDIIDAFVVDEVDFRLQSRIEQLDIATLVTDIMMRNMQDRIRVAKKVLAFSEGIKCSLSLIQSRNR